MRICSFVSNKQYWTVQGILSWAEVCTCKLLHLQDVVLKIFLIMEFGYFWCNRLVDFSRRSASRCVVWLTFPIGLDQMLKTGLRFAGRKMWKKTEEFQCSEQTISRTAVKTCLLCACGSHNAEIVDLSTLVLNLTLEIQCRGSQSISGGPGEWYPQGRQCTEPGKFAVALMNLRWFSQAVLPVWPLQCGRSWLKDLVLPQKLAFSAR